MDVNNFCKIFGIILVLLAYTTFAHATFYNFDCSNTFDCIIPNQCIGVNTISGQVRYDTSLNYNFSSNDIGTNSCQITVETTGYGHPSQAQTDETIEVYVNDSLVAKTEDNHANVIDEVYCGLDLQTFNSNVELRGTNTLRINYNESVGLVRVRMNCQLVSSYFDVCENNLAPFIQNLNDRTIAHNETINIDLWEYIVDYDSYDYLSTLNISYSQSGNSVSCNFDGRYLICDAVSTGTSTITISATDSCNATTSQSFQINVTNASPVLRLTNHEVGCTQDLNRLINLHNFVFDEDVYSLDFNLIQSNPNDLNCYIENNQYISCQALTCNELSSNITVTATDSFGLSDIQTIVFSIKNKSPKWNSNVPNTCINNDTNRIYDLRNYASDPEQGSALNFSLTQNNPTLMNCFIEDSYYLSCNGLSNLHGENQLILTATDNKGALTTEEVIISANCFENVIFSTDDMAICMENFTTYSKQIQIENISNQTKCYEFETEFDIEGVFATITPNNVCVAPNQKTNIILSINSYNSQMDDYKLKLYSTDGSLEMNFDVGIGTCTNFDGFFVEEFDRTVCRGEKWSIPIMVRNTSNETKTISLNADNSYLLPYFERKSITLDANTSRKVNLIVNGKTAPLGYYYIDLSGDANNYHIKKLLELKVIDCSNIKERTFILEVPQTCQEVNKGETFNSYFTIKRTRDTCSNPRDPKNISFFTYGLQTELAYNSKEIECFYEEVIEYSTFINENENAGIHFLKIKATDGQFEEMKEVCINVLGEGRAQFLLKTTPKDIMQGTTEIFELEIRNTGDFDEDFNLVASGMAQGITVYFSEQQFSVLKGQTKTIYVAVTANCKKPIGDSSIIITLQGPEELTTEIRFNVVEAKYSQNLEFLSYTSQIITKSNTQSEYELILRNNTNQTLTNVEVLVEGNPEDINFEKIIISEIKAGETQIVKGKVFVGDVEGLFTPSYVVFTGNIINKQGFNIFVDENPESGFFGGFFGLFAVGAADAIGGIGLALLLILLLLGIILLVTYLRKPVTYERWVVGELDE
jgi:hypothetical protein